MHDVVRTGVVVAVGFCACLLFLRLADFVYTLSKDEQKIVISVGSTLDKLNEDCGGPGDIHPCGTLADVAKTMAAWRGVGGQLEIAANHENKNLSTLDAQEARLFAEVDTTILSAHTTLDSVAQTAQQASGTLQTLNTTVADSQPLLKHLSDVAESANGTVTRVNAALDSPATASIQAHFLSTLTSVDQMAATTSAVETKATHNYLHPSNNPTTRAWQAVKPFIIPTIQIGGAVAAASLR